MKTKKPYLINNKPVDSSELIEYAKEFGYEGVGGIFLTSQAAKVLRDKGFTVETNT